MASAAAATEDASDIDKLYEYGKRLSEAKDKSDNVNDYEGVIRAAKGSTKAKQLAAQLIPRFFSFFPGLTSKAVNAHFDLCEEDELGIRVQAIRALPLLCKDSPEYVSKIVDVLGQLLIAEVNVEREAVHKALLSLLRQDPKASLTALFHHVVASEDIREKVISFIKDKVFPLKDELLMPQNEMERHVTDLVKKVSENYSTKAWCFHCKNALWVMLSFCFLDEWYGVYGQIKMLDFFTLLFSTMLKEVALCCMLVQSLQDVTGEEFKMFMDFLKSLSIFGKGAPAECMQELIEIIEGQADLDAQFKVLDIDHIERLMSCMYMALPFFRRGTSNSKFLSYLNNHIIPVFDKLPEERKMDLLKNLAESSPYTTPKDSCQLFPSIVQLLKKHIPQRKTGEEINFTHVECLLYAFHQLAYKVPNITNSLCGYRIVTGQPSDRLEEDFSDNYKDFTERLTNLGDLAEATMEKLTQDMAEHDKAMANAKTDEAKASIKIKKQNTMTGLRTCNNILAMTQPLHSKSPSFIGDKIITLSWRPATKPSPASTTAAAGDKRTVPASFGAMATKKGRGEGGKSQLVNRAFEDSYHGSRNGARGRGGRGRGRGYY